MKARNNADTQFYTLIISFYTLYRAHHQGVLMRLKAEVGQMSDWPIFRYRFDLPIVLTDIIVNFKVRFLYPAIVSAIFKYRFFNPLIRFLSLNSNFYTTQPNSKASSRVLYMYFSCMAG